MDTQTHTRFGIIRQAFLTRPFLLVALYWPLVFGLGVGLTWTLLVHYPNLRSEGDSIGEVLSICTFILAALSTRMPCHPDHHKTLGVSLITMGVLHLTITLCTAFVFSPSVQFYLARSTPPMPPIRDIVVLTLYASSIGALTLIGTGAGHWRVGRARKRLASQVHDRTCVACGSTNTTDDQVTNTRTCHACAYVGKIDMGTLSARDLRDILS